MGNSIHRACPLVDRTPQLEAVYQQYGKHVYSLLRRLLADEKAAESATADVFVRFSDELASQPNEAHTFLRLRELAVETARRRLKGHRMPAVLHLVSKKFTSLRRRWAAK